MTGVKAVGPNSRSKRQGEKSKEDVSIPWF